MKDIITQRLEILEWEKNNRNISNRGVYDGSCSYQGEIGCALGRLIEDKELCRQLDLHGSITPYNRNMLSLLPEKVQNLGIDFLIELQDLHDNASNWDDAGLSPEGRKVWDDIKQRFAEG